MQKKGSTNLVWACFVASARVHACRNALHMLQLLVVVLEPAPAVSMLAGRTCETRQAGCMLRCTELRPETLCVLQGLGSCGVQLDAHRWHQTRLQACSSCKQQAAPY
jgi:hypothetical protein